MSNNPFKKQFFIALILMVGSALGVSGQGNSDTEKQKQVDSQTERLFSEAAGHFQDGLNRLAQGERRLAKSNFDAAVEVFLKEELKTKQVMACYDELLETVNRFEYPSETETQLTTRVSKLKGKDSCGWKIEDSLIESAVRAALLSARGSKEDESNSTARVGFAEQKFEVPAEDVTKLDLQADERDVSDSSSQQQLDLIQKAVSAKSLGFTFQVHPMIQQYINHYQGRGRTTMATGLYRSGMFMRMARRIFKEEGVPENVVWLGQVESMWKPTAMSWASASGLWQFIPGTGERFGLRRNAYIDERNSFEKATRASARYLKFLANRYGGNWELALAAYNSGEGNVDRAISRAGVANFWAAYPYLPQETRNYVPTILATILIANNPTQYGFGQLRPAAPLTYDTVKKVPALTSLGVIAQAADTTVEYLRYLNPELRTNTTPPEAYDVRVPASKGDAVVAMFKRLPSKDASDSKQTFPVAAGVAKTAYQRPSSPSAPALTSGTRTVKVKKGDTLSKIAAQYNVSASELANFNGLPSVNSPLKVGRDLKVPVK